MFWARRGCFSPLHITAAAVTVIEDARSIASERNTTIMGITSRYLHNRRWSFLLNLTSSTLPGLSIIKIYTNGRVTLRVTPYFRERLFRFRSICPLCFLYKVLHRRDYLSLLRFLNQVFHWWYSFGFLIRLSCLSTKLFHSRYTIVREESASSWCSSSRIRILFSISFLNSLKLFLEAFGCKLTASSAAERPHGSYFHHLSPLALGIIVAHYLNFNLTLASFFVILELIVKHLILSLKVLDRALLLSIFLHELSNFFLKLLINRQIVLAISQTIVDLVFSKEIILHLDECFVPDVLEVSTELVILLL